MNSTNGVASSQQGLIGYVYDAARVRVARGTLPRFTCDFNPADTASSNGFAANASWAQGQSRDQVGEWKLVGGTWTWRHSNVWAGKLLGSPFSSTSGSAVDLYGAKTLTGNTNVQASVNIHGRTSDGTSVISVSVNASDPLVPGAPSTGAMMRLAIVWLSRFRRRSVPTAHLG